MIEAQDVARSRGRTGIERLLRRLGFTGTTVELDERETARIGGGPLRLFWLAEHRTLRVLGCETRAGARPVELAARLLRRYGSRRRGRPLLVLSWRRGGDDLTLAAWCQGPSGPVARTLRIDRTAPGRTDLEVLRSLAPRSWESGAELAARVGLALGREAVGQSFFGHFRSHRDRLAAALEGLPRGTARAERHRRALALLLMSRLVFLYFLERRGWLDGSTTFFARLVAAAREEGSPLFRSRLRPLFFGVLNSPVSKRTAAARRLGRIPYLNGGLFEKDRLERRYPRYDVPDDALDELFGDLLERYNFTVREDRPDDPGTSIDPEMLGKVFEELMESDARKGAGAFYTPRHLVATVVDEALKSVLASRSGMRAGSVRRLLEDPSGVAALEEDQREALRRAASSLRLLDPACGSGAFLLGALHRLLELRRALDPCTPRSVLCREIVQSNLFGVDLDSGAVKLCELRLWLAIVSASEDGEPLAPLPNLDHRIRQGDALLPPLPFQRGRQRLPEARLRELRALREQYHSASGAAKRSLQRRIRRHERSLALRLVEARLEDNAEAARRRFAETRDLFGSRTTTRRDRRFLRQLRLERRRLLRWRRRIHEADELPFFSFEVHLTDVMQSGGFDVIVGNPPWIRWQRIARDARARLAERYESIGAAAWERGATLGGVSGGFAAQPDLAAAFVEASLALVREGGEVGLLVPAKLLQSLSGGGLRRVLASARVHRIEDWSRSPHDLFRADAYPVALWVRSGSGEAASVRVRSHVGGRRPVRCDATPGELRLSPEDPASPWWFVTHEQRSALRRLQGSVRPLGEWSQGRLGRGVLTGANACFLLARVSPDEDGTVEVADAQGRTGRLEAKMVRPVLRGRDVAAFRWKAKEWIIWTHDASGAPLRELPPLTERWLAVHRGALQRRDAVGRGPWWTLFRTRGGAREHRVIWNDVGRRLEAAYLAPGEAIPLNSVYYLAVPSEEWGHAAAAWLNSTPGRAFAAAIAEPAKGGYRRFFSWVLGCVPGPRGLSSRSRATLASLGRRAAGGEDLGAAIDRCVAEATGLSKSDLQVLAPLAEPGR